MQSNVNSNCLHTVNYPTYLVNFTSVKFAQSGLCCRVYYQILDRVKLCGKLKII